MDGEVLTWDVALGGEVDPASLQDPVTAQTTGPGGEWEVERVLPGIQDPVTGQTTGPGKEEVEHILLGPQDPVPAQTTGPGVEVEMSKLEDPVGVETTGTQITGPIPGCVPHTPGPRNRVPALLQGPAGCRVQVRAQSKEQKVTFGSTDARLRGLDPCASKVEKQGPGVLPRGRPVGAKTRPGVLKLSNSARKSQGLGLAAWIAGRKPASPREVARAALPQQPPMTPQASEGGGGHDKNKEQTERESADRKGGGSSGRLQTPQLRTEETRAPKGATLRHPGPNGCSVSFNLDL